MRIILSLLLACVVHSAWATNYYFSSSLGNDSRTSTQAKNSSTPWKTISKLNSFFGSLQPGDSVLFKRGDTFYGSITVNKSGTSSSPIVVAAYGTGNKPIITSLVTLSGWTANSTYAGVYDCSANSLSGSQLNMVLLNDVEQALGRYPNSNASNKGYLTLESHSGKTSITDNQLTSSPNWKGGELVIRISHWITERYPITSHSGSTLYFSGAFEPRNNHGYFIQNSIKTLDQFGEWYYNPSTKKISMYFGSKTPSSYTVKSTAINNLIYADSKSYVVFNNLALKGANENCIEIKSGNHISVTNCDISFSGKDGVHLSVHYYFKLENCTVLNSYNNGVAASASNRYASIRNNIVKNNYYKAGMGQGGQGVGAGIRISNAGIVEYNQVINSGFFGITLGGNNTVVRNNYIDTFCFIKDDGGGIYASSDGSTSYGRKITGNIVLNGIGAQEGTGANFSSADGIYMDSEVNGVEITGNTIANSNRGLYLHNTHNIIVRNNTIFNNINGQLHMKHDVMGGALKNHTITNNIFFSKYAKDVVSSILTKGGNSEITAIGRLDSNYYARPINNTGLILTTTYVYTSSQVKTYRDLANWKSTYNKDPLSKLSSKTITTNPDDNVKFVFNATQVSKTVSLGANYVDAKNNKFSNSIVLKPYSSAVLIKDGTSTTTTGNTPPTVTLKSPVANTSYTTPATINMLATATDANGTISKVQFYNGTTLLHTEYQGTYSYSWTNVPAGTYTITAKATDNNGATTTSAGVKVTVVSKSYRPSINNTSPAVSNNIDFKLSPNPAVSSINLNFNGLLSNQRAILTIQSSLGSVLKRYPVVISGKSIGVDISSLNRGMFIITLATDNLIINKKFLKIN